MTEDNHRLPQDSLHNIILKTIDITNLSNNIIREYFGLGLVFGDERENYRVLNLKEINIFTQYFLENLGSSSRAEILLEIVKEIFGKNEIEIPKDFKNKLVDIYKIRNIFAHNYYPKDLKGITRLESSEPYWPELVKQYDELYPEINKFLMLISSFQLNKNEKINS